jgi:hypothetical protein
MSSAIHPPSQEEVIAPPNDHADVHVLRKSKERDVRFEYTLNTPSPGTSSEHVDEVAYPPINEDAEETRRVEEASPFLMAFSPV